MIELGVPWLLAALPLPLVVRRLLPAHREPRDAVYAPFVERLSQAVGAAPERGAPVSRRRPLQALAFVLAWILTVLALARPQWVGDPLTRTVATRDLLLAIDLSGSMETEDFTNRAGETVDRLSAVKEVVGEFLTRRAGDRVGLIVFGTGAFVQAPFTEDLDVCRVLLDEMQVRMAGPRTAIGDAIGLAVHVFEESELEERVLIVLTDGNDTGSRVPPDKAARVARDRGIVIHTVAVGDPSAAGEEKLDERALRAMAEVTGGIFATATDRAELEDVYAELDALDSREVETQSYRPRRELYAWPLGALLLFTFLFFGGVSLFAGRGRGRSEG